MTTVLSFRSYSNFNAGWNVSGATNGKRRFAISYISTKDVQNAGCDDPLARHGVDRPSLFGVPVDVRDASGGLAQTRADHRDDAVPRLRELLRRSDATSGSRPIAGSM